MKVESSIYKLTFDKFITCICDGDLSPLVIEGNPGEEYLKEAWAKIYTDYIAGISDDEQLAIFNLNKEVVLLDFRITKIKTIIKLLYIQHDTRLVAELKRELALTAQFNPEDQEAYVKALNLAITKSKRLLLDYTIKKKQLDEHSAGSKAEKMERKYFDGLLNRCSQFMNTFLMPENITVSRVIDIVVDRRNFIKASKAKQA